jgi:DNA-binding NarL/FixJ family response regulator
MDHQLQVPTIIVSRPGIMQQALRTSLSLCPAISVIATVGDALNALNQVALLHPALVVIDANLLPDESEALVSALKAGQTPPRCLAFVQSSSHERNLVRAGADAVLTRDSSAQELHTVLTRLVKIAA